VLWGREILAFASVRKRFVSSCLCVSLSAPAKSSRRRRQQDRLRPVVEIPASSSARVWQQVWGEFLFCRGTVIKRELGRVPRFVVVTKISPATVR
jgi:hypothetical protein